MRILLILLIPLLLILAFFFCLTIFYWTVVRRWLQERRKRRLQYLRLQHERLKRVVNGLLDKANEVDQEILYLGEQLDSKSSLMLAQACSTLAGLSESLPQIDRLLTDEELSKSHQAILQSCRIAWRACEHITVVKSAAILISVDKQRA